MWTYHFALLQSLYKRVREDNVNLGAAALGFYLTLALFPALIVLLLSASHLPVARVDQLILDLVRRSLPGDSAEMVMRVVQERLSASSTGLFSVSLVGMLWATSSGMHAVIKGINRAYDITDPRGFFRLRAMAVGMSILVGAMILAAFSFIIFGAVVQEWIGQFYKLSDVVLIFLSLFRWLIIATVILMSFSLIYRFGPHLSVSPATMLPGAIIGAAMLIASGTGFKYLTSTFFNYSVIYGSIGAVIATMVWLYIIGWVILLGAEINAFRARHCASSSSKSVDLDDQVRCE